SASSPPNRARSPPAGSRGSGRSARRSRHPGWWRRRPTSRPGRWWSRCGARTTATGTSSRPGRRPSRRSRAPTTPRASSSSRSSDVGCDFSLGHYREILRAALDGGYRFAFFEAPPGAGDVFLRHDVDLSLEAAVEMAELEAEEGGGETYLLMTRSVFYNLASREGEDAIARLRELGHRVGLHAVHPRVELDARFDPVVAWHNPDPAFMTAPLDGAVNVMEET